jgi:hypothetical protein
LISLLGDVHFLIYATHHMSEALEGLPALDCRNDSRIKFT